MYILPWLNREYLERTRQCEIDPLSDIKLCVLRSCQDIGRYFGAVWVWPELLTRNPIDSIPVVTNTQSKRKQGQKMPGLLQMFDREWGFLANIGVPFPAT
jgi:hypothetical protein